MTIMNAEDFFCTETPCDCTDEGSCGSARLTRFCTSTWASDGSVPISKKAVIVIKPAESSSTTCT